MDYKGPVYGEIPFGLLVSAKITEKSNFDS